MITPAPTVIDDLKSHLPPVFVGRVGILHRLIEVALTARTSGEDVLVRHDNVRFEARADADAAEENGIASAYWDDGLARFEISVFSHGLLYEAVSIADASDTTSISLARSHFADELEDFRDRTGA